MEKRSYEAPEITVVGSVEEITQAGSDGDSLDASFSAGTSRGDLTFS